MKRILCIQLPNWPIQRLRAARPELEGRPFLFSRRVHGVERVVACSHEAAALGVVREQPIAEVKGLAAGSDRGLTILPYDPDADRAALVLWAEYCGRFSPLVGVDDTSEPDSLLLDITTTARLFGGEPTLGQEAVDTLAGERLRVRAAVADTPAGAWAIAHFHAAFIIDRSPLLLVPPGETPDALRLLPIEALRLPDRTVAVLHELGIDLAGQLALLPRDELCSRFGPELLRRWDLARGVQEEPIRPARAQPEFTAAWEAEQPVRRRETIHAALEQVVERLSHDLLAAGRGALRVECRFDCQHGNRSVVRSAHHDVGAGPQAENTNLPPSGSSVRFTLGLFRPTVDVKHLLGLLEFKLEREPLGKLITRVAVAALETGPLGYRQRPLFAGGPASDNNQIGHDSLTQLVERLSSRLGWQAVTSVRLLPDAQPERAWRGKPMLGGARRRRAETTRAGELPPRPLALFARPIALRAMPAVHIHGDGSAFRGEPSVCPWACITFDGEAHDLVGSWGPERIETGWWRGKPIARDYYRAETAAGRRLWLFRQLDTGRWFIHGTFD